MITDKKSFREYVASDAKANNICSFTAKLRVTWKYLKQMRRCEYLTNCPVFLKRVRLLLARYKLHSLSVKSGIQLPPNTFGKGLYLPHFGAIVVNETARFGDFCIVQCGVNISENASGGSGIYFGAGAKVMKHTFIADDVIIGANAVVTKEFMAPNVTIAGVPAKQILSNGNKNREKPI